MAQDCYKTIQLKSKNTQLHTRCYKQSTFSSTEYL